MSAPAKARGHWPAGKRRSPHPLPTALRERIEHALSQGEISRRGIARALRISDRTVRRWLSDEDWPSAGHIERLLLLLIPG